MYSGNLALDQHFNDSFSCITRAYEIRTKYSSVVSKSREALANFPLLIVSFEFIKLLLLH